MLTVEENYPHIFKLGTCRRSRAAPKSSAVEGSWLVSLTFPVNREA